MRSQAMKANELYLKPAAMLEPLVDSWHAWTYLVAPHTAAMVCANNHLRLLESYVKAPELHARAAKDPLLFGGSFLDHRGDRGDVERHAEQIRRRLVPALEFAAAVKAASLLLQTQGDGAPLAALYRQLPESLRGFVELGYDLQNQPSIRFIEALLYRSRYYSVHEQRFLLSKTVSDKRPFVLSTPRYAATDRIVLPFAFNDANVDVLASMRTKPQPVDYVMETALAHLSGAERAGFAQEFFCSEPPVCDPGLEGPCSGAELRVSYLGHATVLLRFAGVSVLIDPLVPYHIPGQATPRWSYCDLPPRIDYVLLTHSHQDHVVLETLLQLRHRIGTVVTPRASGGFLHDPSLKIMLQVLGFASVLELDELESIRPRAGLELLGLPFQGEHGDIHVRSKLTYAIRCGERVLMFAADSRSLDPALFAHVSRWLGAVDCLFLGMECEGAPMSWLYGPLLTSALERRMDQARRLDACDCAQAVEMIHELAPRTVFIYAMGAEPWAAHLSALHYGPDSKQIKEATQLIEWGAQHGVPCRMLHGAQHVELGLH